MCSGSVHTCIPSNSTSAPIANGNGKPRCKIYHVAHLITLELALRDKRLYPQHSGDFHVCVWVAFLHSMGEAHVKQKRKCLQKRMTTDLWRALEPSPVQLDCPKATTSILTIWASKTDKRIQMCHPYICHHCCCAPFPSSRPGHVFKQPVGWEEWQCIPFDIQYACIALMRDIMPWDKPI